MKRFSLTYTRSYPPLEHPEGVWVRYQDAQDLQARIDELEKKVKDGEHELALGAAIEHAAGSLPDDYSIDISIEKHGYGVVLHTPDCGSVYIEECEGIVDEIESLVAYAVKGGDV